jgi:hypothetical protein
MFRRIGVLNFCLATLFAATFYWLSEEESGGKSILKIKIVNFLAIK